MIKLGPIIILTISYYGINTSWQTDEKHRNLKVKRKRITKCLGALSATSAGWSTPTLAKQAPLHLMYFCILHGKVVSITLKIHNKSSRFIKEPFCNYLLILSQR